MSYMGFDHHHERDTTMLEIEELNEQLRAAAAASDAWEAAAKEIAVRSATVYMDLAELKTENDDLRERLARRGI